MAEESSTRSPGRDVGILMFFFLALGLLWFARGGADKVSYQPPLSPFLAQKPGFYADSSSFKAGASIPESSSVYYPPPIPVQFLYEELGVDDIDIEETFAPSDFSQYHGSIFLYSGRAKETEPEEEYIEIRASSNNSAQINITGWGIEGKKAVSPEIPKATRLFRSNQVNIEGNIYLAPGEKAIIVSGHSPIGKSFLVNKCSGYFSQFQDFNPYLSKQCPRPRDEEWPDSLSDDCLDYIERLPRCRANFSIPVYLENECIVAINKTLNYNQCIALHKDESDFYKKEWRIYLNREEELWKDRREKIILRDKEGKIVDEVSYK